MEVEGEKMEQPMIACMYAKCTNNDIYIYRNQSANGMSGQSSLIYVVSVCLLMIDMVANQQYAQNYHHADNASLEACITFKVLINQSRLDKWTESRVEFEVKNNTFTFLSSLAKDTDARAYLQFIL